MSTLLRLWHTVRHLRPVQIYGRIRFRLFRPSADPRPAPPLRGVTGAFAPPARRNPSLTGKGAFHFLGESGRLDTDGWDGPCREKLWRYNQHYFDDLSASEASLRREWHLDLLLRWVQENPPGEGTGWEPYPTSLRTVNWIKWALAGNTLPPACVESLAVQVRWLRRRLEFHLLGNHLFANAKALVFAGLFFSGAEGDAWLREGLEILRREIPEQILSDGGQFERSPMYHALALEDMLDLFNVVRAYSGTLSQAAAECGPAWGGVIDGMRRWLAAMLHPDREISFFNDAAIGIAPAPVELEAYALRLGLEPMEPGCDGVTHLDASGYLRVQRGEGVALLDVAPVGPDYLPGHAHADTLSFELSLFGQRVFVNSGTSCYGSGPERNRQRGTSAHTTVVVNGEDSSEVWGGFRVARRALPVDLEIRAHEETAVVECAHDGYRRLRGKILHRRQWCFREHELVIEDTLSGSFRSAQARFHLHPSVSLETAAASEEGTLSVVLRLPGRQRCVFSVQGGELRAETSTWHSTFGSSEPTNCLTVDFAGEKLRCHVAWGGFS